MCLNCLYSKSPWMQPPHYVDSHGKIYNNITDEPLRNTSLLNSRVFVFEEHSLNKQTNKNNCVNDHRKQNETVLRVNTPGIFICRNCWAVLWKWSGWFSEYHKICRLVESFRQLCLDKKSWHLAASLQDKFYLSPATDILLPFSCSHSVLSFLSCELSVASAVFWDGFLSLEMCNTMEGRTDTFCHRILKQENKVYNFKNKNPHLELTCAHTQTLRTHIYIYIYIWIS